jgi:hypothetical protein
LKTLYPVLFSILIAAGCSKKNDPQLQDASPSYVRLNAQFSGNQGQTFLDGYDASICSATVAADPSGSNPAYSFEFVAADPSGKRTSARIYMESSKLKTGVAGTYTLGNDFYLTLDYHPAAGTTCTNSVFMYSSQASMRTFSITVYDAATKRITGTFEAAATNVANPAVCPITNQTQKGSMQATGEFKNVSVPF